MQFYTTFFDKNYLSRGLELLESLQKHAVDFEMYLLCLDEIVYDYFETNKNKYPQIKTILLADLEKEDTELLNCKTNRTAIEYYFTLSPCLPLYVLRKFNLSHICSLDADIKFYSSPQKLFDYLEGFSIVITPHKFSDEIGYKIKYGKYNVSFQIFKNDEIGLKCLDFWKKQCVDWCKDELDEVNNRFADQKYLDNWTDLYPKKVKSLDDNVSGLAVWNLNNYNITFKNNYFLSNGEKIIFYHFHHNKFYENNCITNGFYTYKVIYKKILKKIYVDYYKNIKKHSIAFKQQNNNLREMPYENSQKFLSIEKTFFYKILNKFIFIDMVNSNYFYKILFSIVIIKNIDFKIFIKIITNYRKYNYQ